MEKQITSDRGDPVPGRRRTSFATQWERYDRMFEGFERRLIAAAELAPGGSVIDVGCGAGTTSLDAAREVGPGGRVLGIDRSSGTLEVARDRARQAGLSQVRFECGDATRYGFTGDADGVVSRFGTLHFAELTAGYAHLRGALRAGGRLTFVCGREQARNLWASVPSRVLFGLLGRIPPMAGSRSGPFVLSDPRLLDSILRGAGFDDIVLESLDQDVWVGSDLDEALEFFFEADGDKLAPLLEAVGYVRAADALREALEPYATADGVYMPASVWLVTARA